MAIDDPEKPDNGILLVSEQRLLATNSIHRVGHGDIRHMNQVVTKPMAIEVLPVGTSHHALRPLGRHRFTACPRCIFPSGPVTLVAPDRKSACALVGARSTRLRSRRAYLRMSRPFRPGIGLGRSQDKSRGSIPINRRRPDN
jgi:hypothetical protein